MNWLKPILFITTLALMGATAGVLAHAKAAQRLGLPGVRTAPLPGTANLEVLLPEQPPGYHSQLIPQTAVVTNMLPQDTSFGQRIYTGDDGFRCQLSVVLMGTSRSSIHKPQVCLTGQGWTINDAASHVESVQMDRPYAYELPVMRLEAARMAQFNDQNVLQKGIYVYWFVDADRYTAEHANRMLWMAHDMVFKNELDRWAYVAFFAVCNPGQEQATFDRMKRLIVTTVPEFQLVPKGPR